MCVDDVVCTGAEPLFFLDYVAVGRLDAEEVAELVSGVAAGCRDAGCALVGGETAEHPGLMEPGEFDLAGFCVGVVECDERIDGTAARAGDAGRRPALERAAQQRLLARALADGQLGPRLARPYQEQLQRTLGAEAAADAIAAEPEHALATLGEVLLTPTTIYTAGLRRARVALREAGHDLRGLAHITGGGLRANAARALPMGLGARLDPSSWRVPSVARLMAALGGLDDEELRSTFNAGIGMVAVVSRGGAAAALALRSPEAFAPGWSARSSPVDRAGPRYVEVPPRGGG